MKEAIVIEKGLYAFLNENCTNEEIGIAMKAKMMIEFTGTISEELVSAIENSPVLNLIKDRIIVADNIDILE